MRKPLYRNTEPPKPSPLQRGMDLIASMPVKSFKQPDRPHVEDVFEAFQKYQNDIRRALDSQGPLEKAEMAKRTLRKKLEAMGIYLDYRERK